MIFVIWMAVAVIALVLYLREAHSKLRRSQLNHLPVVPLFGNMTRVFFRREHLTAALKRSYEAFPEDRLVGHYEFVNPLVMIKDLELLKNVTVKDFDHFVDRRAFGDTGDPVFGRNLVLLKGEEWKSMRASLSPTFTSSKIRLMVPFMLEVGEKMMERIKNDINNSKDGSIVIDVKDLSTRFANDVIATCVFGLKVNSQVKDNEFYKKIKAATNFDFKRFLTFIGFRSFPALMRKLKISFFPQHIGEFFATVVLGTMKHREKNNIVRNDMIHLLMELKKGNLSHDTDTKEAPVEFATAEEFIVEKKHAHNDWSDTDLVAQAVVFLLAGFETVSTTISFLLHELAVNPEVQEKLVKEIRENEAKTGGQFDYNAVQEMVYFDMVISELLRKWPPATLIDRICVKDYNAGKPNRNAMRDYIVQKGQTLTVPIYSFHRDVRYFPNPDKFDPERFSPDNRHNIKPYTYMPFGVGPRICIGSRFALCEVKVMVYQLLKLVEVIPCEKTCIPARLSPESVALRMAGGHWLRFRMRQS